MNGDPSTLGIDELRARREELQTLDDAVSYVRRVAQARSDLARSELARRDRDDATNITDELRDVLSDRLLGGPGRPPRPVEDFSEDAHAVALDQLCAEHGFGRLDELEADGVAALIAALDAFEHDISAERQQVFTELDALTDELVARYREQHAGNGNGDAAAADDDHGAADDADDVERGTP